MRALPTIELIANKAPLLSIVKTKEPMICLYIANHYRGN